MCVAIAQKRGAKSLSDTQLDNGWKANPDGGGYAYIHPETNEIVVRKYLVKDDFILAYKQEHEEFGDSSPFIVHMRIETHGGVSLDTTHPFRVDRDEGMMVFAHNGIINAVDSLTEDGVSDTMAFSGWILADLPDGWLDNAAISELVEDYIGSSKLVFLTTEPAASGQMYVIGESMGHWNVEKDTWFSNYSCSTVVGKGWYRGTTPTDHWWSEVDDWEKEKKEEDKDDDLEGLFAVPQKGLAASNGDTMLPRFMVTKEYLSKGLEAVGTEAEKQGYCSDCLYKPCQCDTTCYYCSRAYGTCKCDYWITIGDMMTWVGEDGFKHMREEDIIIFSEANEREGKWTA